MGPQDFSQLDTAGLNRQHVFEFTELPPEIRARLPGGYRQLILIGHGGRRLWEALQTSRPPGPDPIDQYTVNTLAHWLDGTRHTLLYPGEQPIGLQALGALAGWHQPSPFMIGVDARWGSWYAYRAVILADTDFPPSRNEGPNSPCPSCTERPCIAACPASALSDGQFELAKCATWRLRENSVCAHGCLARLACPIGQEHRYTADQIRHSYAISLEWLRQPPSPR